MANWFMETWQLTELFREHRRLTTLEERLENEQEHHSNDFVVYHKLAETVYHVRAAALGFHALARNFKLELTESTPSRQEMEDLDLEVELARAINRGDDMAARDLLEALLAERHDTNGN